MSEFQSNVTQQKELANTNAIHIIDKEFTYNLETFAFKYGFRKEAIASFVEQHFKEDIDYDIRSINGNELFFLSKPTYNFLNNVQKRNKNFKPYVNRVTGMSSEHQVLTFIESCLRNLCECERSKTIGDHIADLCINDSIIIECEDFRHDYLKEFEREQFYESCGYRIVRFNAYRFDFDVSTVIRKVMQIIIADLKSSFENTSSRMKHDERILELKIELQCKELELKKLQIQSQQIHLSTQSPHFQ